MESNPRLFVVFVFALLIAAAAGAHAPVPQQTPQQAPPAQSGAVSPGVWSKPAGQQPQASSAFQSACGSQPLCYDAQDFAVAVVDFRMSITNGVKVMDATLRFVNKTAQPIILGYVDGSAVALDDQGNRYGTYYNKGMAGIGLVSGMNADPKFLIQPSGGGDARFELMWRPGQQDAIGSTFELDMTIRGINTLVGGQHTLGAEIPLRFQGLANGMTGAGLASSAAGGPAVAGAPGVATAAPQAAAAMFANGGAGTAAAPVCGPNGSTNGTMNAVAGTANSVGGQQTANATSTANNTANNAAAAFSNLKSIFGKKNANAAAANSAAPAGSPCVPAAAASPTAASAAPASATAPSAAATVSAGAKPAVAAAPATTAAAGAAKNGTAPVATTPATPASAARPAAAKPATAIAAKPATQPATSTAKKPAPAANQNKTNTDPNKPSQR